MKHIFVIIIFFFLSHPAFPQPPFAQKNEKLSFMQKRDNNDSHLRVCMTLLDTIHFSSDCYDCETEGTFLFKIKINAYGYYKHEFIWVKCGISRSNMDFWRNGFWWVLIKTKETIGDLPVYRHSGNF